jgi:hypothetical protein
MIRWGAPFAVQKLAFDEESMLLVVVAILFVLPRAAWVLDLPLVTGAFLAGVSLSTFPVNMLVRGQLSSLSDFFHALFFTALGAFLPLPRGASSGCAVLALARRWWSSPPRWWPGSPSARGFPPDPRWGRDSSWPRPRSSPSWWPFSGSRPGSSPGLLTVIALVTVITMVATPFLATDRVALGLMRVHPSRRRKLEGERPQDHVLLLGCGRNGMSLLELLIISPFRVVVVDDDPALVDHLADAEVEVIRGDISDPAVLRRAGADRARVVISTIRRADENLPLLAIRREGPTLVRVFHEEDAERFRAMGATPILYSEAAADEILAWIDGVKDGEADEANV